MSRYPRDGGVLIFQRRRKVKLQNPASGFSSAGMEGAAAPRQPSVMSSGNGSLHSFQRLHKELPLSLEDLEDVLTPWMLMATAF